jgi:hypothetical protein
MLYRNVIKTTIQICGIQHLDLWFLLQSTYIFPLLQKCVFTNVLKSPTTPTLGQSLSHHQHEQQNQTQQEFKIQTPKCPMAYSYL